ncbi:MAG TPA: PASTA domain-containing protein [Streptosporangiaceae bacterium]|jgi:serine/threonine-protein kinase
MDTTLSPPTGQLLDGRYRVDSRLAHGGMATVYLGKDVRLERVVALKIAHAELAGDQEFVRRFITEARAVAQLSSHNVVAVYDQGTSGDINYIAMEYVPGPTLREVLAARGALSVREALDVIEGVLSGLAAAHRAGIIHRDVKPENVLLGTDGVVKVADFGLARAAAASSHTKTGMIIGTAAYLAPEQVADSTSDSRTDVYAAGVMLFEMLTGVQPHTGESPLMVAYKHVNDVVPPPSSLQPGLPPALDSLVALATCRDPAGRPADAAQFLQVVTEVRSGSPISLPVPGQGAAGGGSNGGRHAAASGQPTGADPMEDTDLGPLAGISDGSLALPPAAGQRGGPSAQANHTLVVSPDNFVPGFGPGQGGRGRRGGFQSDREPPLQRLLFSRRLLYVLGGLAAVLVTVLVIWWLTAGQYVKVPQVAGWSTGLARTELTHLGFKVSDGPGVHSNLPQGNIVSTSPRAGSSAKDGSTITLTLSLGPVKIPVPSVTGEPLAQAQQQLKSAGLVPGTPVQTPSTTIAAGVVVSTDPVAGTDWPKDKPVGITVSAGPPLPDFIGGQVAAAEAAAAAGGYHINPVNDTKSTQPSGTVVRQSPVAGTPIHAGEVVTVYVSTGPPQVAVPNVDGMGAHQAAKTLEAAGFQVSVNKGFGNRVTGYSPSGEAPAGSTITINVGMVL